MNGAGVRPLSRSLIGSYNRVVYANTRPDARLSVGHVREIPFVSGIEHEVAGDAKLIVSQSPINGIQVHGMKLTQFRALLAEAHADLARICDESASAGLGAVRRLVDALAIND
jgi:hypothetical protein